MSKRKKTGAAKGPSKRGKNTSKPTATPVSPDEASLDRLTTESAAPEIDDQPPAATPSDPETDAAPRGEETDDDVLPEGEGGPSDDGTPLDSASTDDDAPPNTDDQPSEASPSDAEHTDADARAERPSDIAPSAPSLHESTQPGEQLEIDGLDDDDDDDAPGSGPGDTSERAHLKGLIEALIFAADKPLKVGDLARHAEAAPKVVRALLVELAAEYRPRGIQLDDVGNGFQFRTNPRYGAFVRDLTAQKPVRLTRAQLETLAILAYRQPITRPEIDEIRGVDSGPVLKMLLERELVRILGKKDEPGRPILYGTTPQFLEFFGLVSLKDLPSLREFTELTDESQAVAERELGEAWRRPVAEPDHDDGSLGEHAVDEGALDPQLGEHAVDEGALAPELASEPDDRSEAELDDMEAPSEGDAQQIDEVLSTSADETLADANADETSEESPFDAVDEPNDVDPVPSETDGEPPPSDAVDEPNDVDPIPSETDGEPPPSV